VESRSSLFLDLPILHASDLKHKRSSPKVAASKQACKQARMLSSDQRNRVRVEASHANSV
jgi:hypothetical protein